MKNLFKALVVISLLDSCSAVFEKSIENSSIEIYTPADSFSTRISSQQFYWEPVEHATNYRLQIAKPSFNSGLIQAIVLDTVMTGSSITVLLSTGEYEWRLRAQNAGSETVYYTRKLFVQEIPFNQRTMIMVRPSTTTTSFSTYIANVLFQWAALTGTQSYFIEIDALTDNFTSPVIYEINQSILQNTVTLPTRGKYIWRMYADSLGVRSNYSVIGNIDFKMDTVGLLTPANNSPNLTQSIELRWAKPLNHLSNDVNQYEVSLYSSLSNSDLLTGYPAPLTTNEFIQITGLSKGTTYYWAVRVIDKDGVPSVYTKKYKFTTAL